MTRILIAAAMIGLAVPVAVPAPAIAQHHSRYDTRWQGDRDSRWDPADHYRAGKYRERRLGRNDRIYRGRDGRYYCRRSNGTTGLVVGGIAGGLLGNAIAGGTLGTLIGAGGGALLGRSIDRGDVKCR
ncbi:MAG TPA: glycine zipper 2TM domain-containing protein [Sphingomonas sp.]|nr:glycine zipper 2TM domain-containing protein [Sphingomonas sp.]